MSERARPLKSDRPPRPPTRADLQVAVVFPTATQAESWGGWLALAFQAMGFDVKAFPYRDISASGDPHSMNRQLVRRVRRWNSDLLVVVKGELVDPRTLALARKEGCRIALLANDDHQVWESVSKPLGKECDRVFTFTKGSLPWYEAEGIAAEHMLFYADPEVCRLKETRKLYDVSFVGTYYPERLPLVQELMAAKDLKFRLLGDGWNDRLLAVYGGDLQYENEKGEPVWERRYGGRADYAEVLRTWNASKVCLNIHQDGLKKLGVVANLRCYELGAAGCFMATDLVEGMDVALCDPREPRPYTVLPEDPRASIAGLRDMASEPYDQLREDGASRLRRVVLEKHTPENRARQILRSFKVVA